MVFVLDPFYAASYWSSVNADKWPLYFGFVFLPSDRPRLLLPPPLKNFRKEIVHRGGSQCLPWGMGGKERIRIRSSVCVHL